MGRYAVMGKLISNRSLDWLIGWFFRYIIWENLLYILREHRAQSPVYLGRLGEHPTVPRGFVSGGAVYLISQPAVRMIVDDG